ncbi:type I-C CRISPR-associated protein Cas8c/Csd1 [Providencia burhodogranariea]|uniref:CRISPR-associated protein n=1 Tax=Providencia burhodogranariea DSM 19968 TaxID=1141662 RepID=K8WSN3_9GAMM|nr:type I-C CRISPR-associated protein Cas8c/Csd1 [Providencia burhodogranariea]EKT63593.1 CRISPR-associated protein [Providencia burhodogranariea DSM 19968]
MSWIAKLYETYEHAQERYADLPIDEQVMPVSHTIQNAHIHVILDGNGNFINAEVIDKKPIIIPATESSAGRASGLSAHALADKLQYVAGDYAKFGGIKKSGFDLYQAQLTEWVNSGDSPNAVKSILTYINKRSLIYDLIEKHILYVKDGVLLTQWESDEEQPNLFKQLPKEKGILDQGAALVCWSVQVKGIPQSKTWLDRKIQQSWIDFDSKIGGGIDVCYVSGQSLPKATNHPAKLRHSGDKAKLVSANDTSGFTFRGRFANSEQANNVSFEVTQKAHNALRWLINRQGFRTDEQIYVAWAVSGKEIAEPKLEETEEFDFNSMFDNSNDDNSVNHLNDLGATYASELNKYFSGYFSIDGLDTHEQIAIIGLDSATPGRMSIIYYRETIAQEFIDRLHKWQLDLGWWQRKKAEDINNKGKTQLTWSCHAPALFKILNAVYGDVLKSSTSLKKNLISRLYPCIVEGRPLPIDIVNYAFERAINRVAYKSDETWLWQQNIGIACSLYKGYCKRTANKQQNRDYDMALNTTYRSRDYLFGRLLAVANKIEQFALSIGEGNRLTTAERYMTRFVNKPAQTWLAIVNALQPYQQRLHAKYPSYDNAYKSLLSEITDLFEIDDFKLDKKLTPEFLLGFHSQMLWLEQHKLSEGKWIIKNKESNSESQTVSDTI